jgi:hypothetical protein
VPFLSVDNQALVINDSQFYDIPVSRRGAHSIIRLSVATNPHQHAQKAYLRIGERKKAIAKQCCFHAGCVSRHASDASFGSRVTARARSRRVKRRHRRLNLACRRETGRHTGRREMPLSWGGARRSRGASPPPPESAAGIRRP